MSDKDFARKECRTVGDLRRALAGLDDCGEVGIFDGEGGYFSIGGAQVNQDQYRIDSPAICLFTDDQMTQLNADEVFLKESHDRP